MLSWVENERRFITSRHGLIQYFLVLLVNSFSETKKPLHSPPSTIASIKPTRRIQRSNSAEDLTPSKNHKVCLNSLPSCAICWSPFHKVWNQIRPDSLSGLICQADLDSSCLTLWWYSQKNFTKKSILKKSTDDKKQWKLSKGAKWWTLSSQARTFGILL